MERVSHDYAVGLVTLLVARASGAAKVILIDGLANRLALAAQLGANATLNFRDEDPEARIAELTAGGSDFVFDASGSAAGSASAPGLAARGGSYIQWQMRAHRCHIAIGEPPSATECM